MKQHITPEQLNELTDEQKERLREWWEPRWGDRILPIDCEIERIILGSCRYVNKFKDDHEEWGFKDDFLPLLSIGQMVEFLEDNNKKPGFYKRTNTNEYTVAAETYSRLHTSEELCDALWQAVKEVL